MITRKLRISTWKKPLSEKKREEEKRTGILQGDLYLQSEAVGCHHEVSDGNAVLPGFELIRIVNWSSHSHVAEALHLVHELN